MVQMSRLDADKDKEDIIYLVINSYLNYDKILENQLIVAQNMQDIQSKLEEITKIRKPGVGHAKRCTAFSAAEIADAAYGDRAGEQSEDRQLQYEYHIGSADTTEIILPPVNYKVGESFVFTDLVQQAEANRRELQDLSYQTRAADINVKKIHDQRYPTVSASGGMYYINPTGQVIPTNNNLIAPITLGIGASWDIGTLYTNKNKEREAAVQRRELNTSRDQTLDDIHQDVHKQYILYQSALEKIKVLEVAINQAQENERITESKFRNNLVNTTDRIDAQTDLYQARVNLELAKSDATISYYDVLRSTGKIHL